MPGYYLALYDFVSKQKYIYRTPRIKEISGASALLDGMYRRLITEVLKAAGVIVRYDTESPFSLDAFENRKDEDGEVLYDGGGNLMVLYHDKCKYVKANRLMSEYLLRYFPGLTMIAAGVPYTGDFNQDKKNLYEENRRRKNLCGHADLSGVTPFTQIDPMTFGAVTRKSCENGEPVSMSADRVCKREASGGKQDMLDENTGLLAVIYVDGNAMGMKLREITIDKNGYDDGVKAQREFSADAKRIFVTRPEINLNETGLPFRKILGGGDEMTLLCRAEDAWTLTKTYFGAIAGNDKAFTSCAGIAVFHAGAPFTVAYEIAEECCENAKKKAKEINANAPGNMVDFYYCHGGITAGFDALRGEQSTTARPYELCDAEKLFDAYGEKLRKAGRSNTKALGDAAHAGINAYRAETKRVNAYIGTDMFDGSPNEMRTVYDMSEFYDLWFAASGKEGQSE